MDNDIEYPAGGGMVEQFHSLTYQPLPYLTHPIDTAIGPQGWGPFHGAYRPWDFESANDTQAPGGIDIFWTQGDNVSVRDYAPSYDVLTLMSDKSLDLVDNQGTVAVMQTATQQVPNNSSTFTNSNPVQTTGISKMGAGGHGFWQALSDWVRSVA